MSANTRIDPSFYRGAIVASNVATIEEARLVYLAGAHPGQKDDSEHTQFNNKIIEVFKGCQILVEDSYEKSTADLDKTQIIGLNTADYSIEGWDDPERCKGFADIGRTLSAIKAMQTKWNSFSEACDVVQAFALRYPTPTFTDNTHLLLFCELRVLDWDREYNLETFPKVQVCLRDRSVRALNNGQGPVFVLTGENHVDARNEPFKTWSKEFVDSLGNIPYMILNPARINRAPPQKSPTVKIL